MGHRLEKYMITINRLGNRPEMYNRDDYTSLVWGVVNGLKNQ
jgi:hypothetical protein